MMATVQCRSSAVNFKRHIIQCIAFAYELQCIAGSERGSTRGVSCQQPTPQRQNSTPLNFTQLHNDTSGLHTTSLHNSTPLNATPQRHHSTSHDWTTRLNITALPNTGLHSMPSQHCLMRACAALNVVTETDAAFCCNHCNTRLTGVHLCIWSCNCLIKTGDGWW